MNTQIRNAFLQVLLLCNCALQSYSQDTVMVEIEDHTVLMLISRNIQTFQQLRHINLNQLMDDVIRVVAQQKLSDKDTVLRFDYPTGWIPAEQASKNPSIKSVDQAHLPTDTADVHKLQSKVGAIQSAVSKDKTDKPWFSTFYLDIGLNNYLDASGRLPREADPYDLRVPNSTYVGVGAALRRRIFSLRSQGYIGLDMGLLLDFYNFKFYSPYYLARYMDGQIGWRNYQDDFEIPLRKSKLVVSYINIPLRLVYRAKNSDGDRTFSFGIGGYVGYRVNAWTKVNPIGAAKSKDHGNFNLSPIRYGMELQAGYGSVLLFFKYDFNTLFRNDQTPVLQPFALGIRI